MQALRPDVHVSMLRPFLDEGDTQLGSQRVDTLLNELGTSREELAPNDAWISLDLLQALLSALQRETDDPTMMERCARLSLSPRYLGVLRPLFRAFGTPLFAYSQIAAATGRFNKVGNMSLVEGRPGEVTLEYTAQEGAPPETEPLVCRGRAAQLAAVPTMFDLPVGALEHLSCLHEGDETCRYRIRWRARGRRWRGALGFVLGGAAGAAAALLLGLAGLGFALVASLGALTGWLAVRSMSLGGQLSERADDVARQQDALTRSIRLNEQRFAELLEAKAEVEEKVRQRTAELRHTSETLADALDELQQMSSAKDRFFANVSHELRTPLTLILAPLEELASGREPPGGRLQAFSAMQRNASRLLTLINQLLDLAKVDAGAMQLRRAPVDLAPLLRELVDGFVPSAGRRGLEVRVDLPEHLAPMSIDPSWIESAVTNLVANALKYAESEVHVRLEDRVSGVCIEVEDDGPGMHPEEADKVFERFTQATSAEGRGGTGLGLSIVREAARLHEGEATVRTREGEGTTFTLTLPRTAVSPSVAPPAPVESPRPSPQAAALHVAAQPAPAPPDEREGPGPDAPLALVIEDNDDLRAYISDVLASRYRVRTARDGEAGLAMALELCPQVVVSDIAMPRMDGLAMTRRLREHDETRTTPIVLVTAHRNVTSVLQGFDAGADDYVSKPFHGRELLARVDVHVRLRQLIREMAHRERLATLGVVAASVAHQVRNPLTVLQSGLPAMRKRLAEKVDEPTREMLDVMIGCATRIERMTVDLLDLSRVDRAEVSELRPGEGLAAACRLVGAGIPSGVELDVDVDETVPMSGRPADLNHVFLNLVDNASRAVGETGRIEVAGSREGDHYIVRVEDSGEGIPGDLRDRIFEPFWTSRPAGQGTGLGLSIARQVVEQHGGSITVGDSALGGAAFEVRLPLGSSREREAGPDRVLSYEHTPTRPVDPQ